MKPNDFPLISIQDLVDAIELYTQTNDINQKLTISQLKQVMLTHIESNLDYVDSNTLIQALSLKADSSSISTVGLSNNYNDLDNLPTLPAVVAQKIPTAFWADGVSSSFVVLHNANTFAIQVSVSLFSTGEIIYPDIILSSVNEVTITLGYVPAAGDVFRVVVIA